MTLSPARPADARPRDTSGPAAETVRRGRAARAAGTWLARLGLVLLALLVPLLLLEAALRLFGPILPGNYRTGSYQTTHPVYGRFHLPSFDGWIRNPEFTARVRTNAIGLRDDEVVLPKPSGTFRVLVVGDSLVEGAQVPVEHTFTEVMQRDLNAAPHARGLRYDVVNAGIGGWGPPRELLWLRQEGLALQPDLVVAQLYLGNDVSDSACKIFDQDEKFKVCFRLTRDGQLVQEELRVRPQPENLRTRLRQSSLLFNVIETGVLEKTDPDLADDDRAAKLRFQMGVYARSLPRAEQQKWDEAWRTTGALVEAMRNEVEAGGSKLVVFAIPNMFEIYPAEWQKVAAEAGLEPDRWDFARPNQRLGEVAREKGIRYLDLGPVFLQEAPSWGELLFFPVDGHLTAAGHEVVARHLAAYLQANGLVP